MKEIHTYIYRGCPCVVMVKVMDCGIIVRKPESGLGSLMSRYIYIYIYIYIYVYFIVYISETRRCYYHYILWTALLIFVAILTTFRSTEWLRYGDVIFIYFVDSGIAATEYSSELFNFFLFSLEQHFVRA